MALSRLSAPVHALWRHRLRPRRPSEPNHGTDGFTLLEILVAIAILGLSLSVLLGTFTLALDRARESRTKEAAQALAQALLLRVETAAPDDIRPEAGAQSPLYWRIAVQDFGSAEDRQSWKERALQVRVTVFWNDHARKRSLSLSTLRLLPKDSDG